MTPGAGILDGAWPPFGIDGWWLALARGLFDAALAAGFGGPVLVAALGAGPAAPPGRATGRAGLALALALGLAWLALETAAMAGTDGPRATLAALPTVAAETRFGRILLAQLALAALGVGVLRRGCGAGAGGLGAALAAAALALQALHGHAAAMGGAPLLGAGISHLLAGGAWLGSLAPLCLALRRATPAAAARAGRRYARLGGAAVAVLAATALWQGAVLIGSLPAVIGTAYGLVACAKAALLAAMTGIAWRNQFRLVPALDGFAPERARRRLARAVAAEAGIGLAVMLAAGVLASLPPGMHVQPVWPFSWRPSTITIDEDPGFRREALLALAALAGATVLAAAAWWLRPRPRVAALAVAAVVAVLATPHLDLLLVEAHPSSFYRSPTRGAAGAVVEGEAVYAARCASCHGADHGGHGALAASLPIPPADLATPMIRMHDDGELFWWIGHGIEGPDGRLAMPGFADVLSDARIWAVIDALRAVEQGASFRAGAGRAGFSGVAAPGFDIACGDATLGPTDRAGRALVVAIGHAPPADPMPMPAPAPAPAPLVAVASPDAPVPRGDCAVADRRVGEALAIVTGLAPRAPPPGTLFVIDGAGRVEARLAPDPDPGQDRTALERALRGLSNAAPEPAGASDAGMRM